MGQGKSNACRVIMLGCALDPLAELDVFVFANNGDFDAYAPRLARYVKGVEDDAIAAAVDRLHELYAEVGRREGRLADLGAKKVTRQLAQGSRGPAADRRAVLASATSCSVTPSTARWPPSWPTKTIKRARKTGITLLFDTQSSRKEAIPPKLVELVSVNACFYVKTWRSNDGFLGDGSFAAGIRATELRPGRDRGTSAGHGCVRRAVRAAALVLRRGRRRHRVRRRGRGDRPRGGQVAPGTAVEAARPWPRSRPGTCSTTWTRCSAPTACGSPTARAATRPRADLGAVPGADRSAAARPPRRRRGAHHEAATPAARPGGPSPRAGRAQRRDGRRGRVS